MWKKICGICFALLILLTSSVFAATKEDVISAIKKTYEIGDETFKLPSGLVKKAENYLNKNPLSEEQYENILGNIDSMVDIAEKNGTTDISKISVQDKMKAIELVVDASHNANVDLEKELEENNITLPISTPTTTPSTQEENPDNGEDNTVAQGENEGTEVTNDNPEIAEPADNTGTSLSDILPSTNDGISAAEATKLVNRNIMLAIGGIILILFVLFLILYLLFKSKWNKIVKYILIVIFVLLVLVCLATLVIALVRLDDIRAVYKL
ncbi:MAG: hypothetical protein IJ867_04645, partial [Clostridia bacterium]|nr:hypothetical protein [Clostridia bacterium]